MKDSQRTVFRAGLRVNFIAKCNVVRGHSSVEALQRPPPPYRTRGSRRYLSAPAIPANVTD